MGEFVLGIGDWVQGVSAALASRLERLGAKEGQFTGARAFLAVKYLDRDLRNGDRARRREVIGNW
jgi:hypothetical protein